MKIIVSVLCPAVYKAFTYIMPIHLKFTTFLSFNPFVNVKKLGLRKDEELTNAAGLVISINLYQCYNTYGLHHLSRWLHDDRELCFK